MHFLELNFPAYHENEDGVRSFGFCAILATGSKNVGTTLYLAIEL